MRCKANVSKRHDPDGMLVCMFISKQNCGVLGFTKDTAADALPRDLAPWVACGSAAITETDPRANAPSIHAAVTRDGYCILPMGAFA
jgi:hypothetical protein